MYLSALAQVPTTVNTVISGPLHSSHNHDQTANRGQSESKLDQAPRYAAIIELADLSADLKAGSQRCFRQIDVRDEDGGHSPVVVGQRWVVRPAEKPVQKVLEARLQLRARFVQQNSPGLRN